MFAGSFRKFVLAAVVAVAGTAMVATSFEVEARRLGGGSSMGRQSAKAATAPHARSMTPSQAPSAASAASGKASAAAPRSGMSRWLGPLAGIAAGLGLAALLSHLGLSGAFAEMLSSLLLIGLVVFAVLFIIRRLRASRVPRPMMQGAGVMGQTNHQQADRAVAPSNSWRSALSPAATGMAAGSSAPASLSGGAGRAPAEGDDGWQVPADFDTVHFLQQAKEQFIRIQGIWDSGNLEDLRNYLTDDLILELKPQLVERQGSPNRTEVVLLNADLLGIEVVTDGYLASVRFSGMLREQADADAFRFEEVWNLFKPTHGGWLLAGIQQHPVS
jgi:predicted lipid-binding transport protein (Tim44 family)